MVTSTPPQPKIDTLHRERSKFLDEFARLEEALREMLSRAGADLRAQHFSQRIDLARKQFAAKPETKLNPSDLRRVFDICEDLGNIRNDVVHSQMQRMIIDGVAYAAFSNNNHVCPVGSIKPLLLTLKQLTALLKECEKASSELQKI